MREALTQGVICLRDPETGIEYRIADISYMEQEDGVFAYTFEPRYSVIDLLKPPLFQGIPGLNLDLRRERYVRENRTPVFISERVPAENREDLWELLDAAGMEYLNKLEWLMRTSTRYGGDALYVSRPEGNELEPAVVEAASIEGGRPEVVAQLLAAVAAGREVRGDGFVIDDSNRAAFHGLLRALYLGGDAGKRKACAESAAPDAPEKPAGRGRRKKSMDEIAFHYAAVDFEKGRITAEEAAKRSGVSRATFFRRLKEQRGSEPA